ncbi:hypothetical protein FDV58_21185 [Bradyrhizobium elkanii]|uniref:Uncharacterized protein n=1 Tax=Bradyrhizobium elkanii TaxID=29448 RepID=A0A4U6RY32_BRAEL|nr:hypothetical protein [Bradyrhizobium sp. BR2003]TKV79670.1 hypothetical protein FDV58_21185 [Bradyrhizobium elkanii]
MNSIQYWQCENVKLGPYRQATNKIVGISDETAAFLERFFQASIDAAQKGCGQPLGEGWPRANRSGTGRGGDVTGSRTRKSSGLLSASLPLQLQGGCRRVRPTHWDRPATAA